MRKTTELFKINGRPLLVPDEAVEVGYEDLDASDSGRDESGVMHRSVVRYKVGNWKFSYTAITEAERQYMENLFPNSPTFQFTHPARLNTALAETTTCYRSKYGISWKNAVTGLWSGYSFSIIEC